MLSNRSDSAQYWSILRGRTLKKFRRVSIAFTKLAASWCQANTCSDYIPHIYSPQRVKRESNKCCRGVGYPKAKWFPFNSQLRRKDLGVLLLPARLTPALRRAALEGVMLVIGVSAFKAPNQSRHWEHAVCMILGGSVNFVLVSQMLGRCLCSS